MTPLFMQDALIDRVNDILSGMELMGGKVFTVYSQTLPPRREEKDDSIFPFVRVFLGDGEDGGEGDNTEATQDVVIVIATMDTNADRQGYRDAMNAIQRLREHFCKDPDICGYFTIKKPLRWAAPDPTETHSKYYGALQFKVELPQIEIDLNYRE